jgi:hypothetical protein
MRRLLLTALLLAGCAIPIEVSGISIAVPAVSSELAGDKPHQVMLQISGTNETTEVFYVALQYQDGTRWINLSDPIEILLDSSVEVPLELAPGTYTLRTALWGLKPEGDTAPDKVSSDAMVEVIDNEAQLTDIRALWQERRAREQKAFARLNACVAKATEKCSIASIQAVQDFIWASQDVKDQASLIKLTSNLQPQFSSFIYFHNITTTKLEANYLAYCQDRAITQTAVSTCKNKLQTKDIQRIEKSLRQSLKVLNTLLANNSYAVIS